MEITKKMIYVIDAVILLGSLFSLAAVAKYSTPLVISPINDLSTANGSVLFQFANADTILIDDNKEFSSPEIVMAENNLVVNLKPGKYYWKIKGAKVSEIRELTIESVVDLRLEQTGTNQYNVVNAGNTELNVDTYDKGSYTGSVVLDIDEKKNISATSFIGGTNETK